MSFDILTTLERIWSNTPQKSMLVCDHGSLNFADFQRALGEYLEVLKAYNPKVVALIGDNRCEWVFTDIACQVLDITFLPLPGYFTPAQIQHSLESAGADLLLIEQGFASAFAGTNVGELGCYELFALSSSHRAQLPPHTAKITFTSGSTGDPKGVCLSKNHQWQVAESIKSVIDLPIERHLCILPFATLLENVAGVYSALLHGATVVIPGLASLGFKGSSSIDFRCLVEKVSLVQPGSLITTPELLRGLIVAAESGWPVPDSLAFIAVGGARVSSGLLARAKAVNLPVYQGYGLSECGSVVSLNSPNGNLEGSCGKILPHVKVSIEDDEVMVQGATFLGYANQPQSWHQDKIATGDFGEINDGYLNILGRKSNLLISSFGRNINPEWVESELLSSPLIAQAFVFGEEQPYCVAAVLPSKAEFAEQLETAIASSNQNLPDYAQIKRFFILPQAVTPVSGLMTANGRPRRAALKQFLQSNIDSLY